MLRRGEAPYLECSSKGDKRFSAFYARPKSLNGKSIEDAYQAKKIFADGTTGLGWREAKGRHPINLLECQEYYYMLWEEWIKEQNLLPILKSASGLSDIFGIEGNTCQAEVLWRIRNVD